MRKGITPIISIIVLLLITVALAGVAYTYLTGIIPVEKSFVVVTGGVYCLDKTVTINLKNTGTTTIDGSDELDNDFIVKSIDAPEGWVTSTMYIPDIDAKETESVEFCATDTADNDPSNGCSGTLVSGVYRVRLGTTSGVQQLTVTC
jgi:flagellin-like protein